MCGSTPCVSASRSASRIPRDTYYCSDTRVSTAVVSARDTQRSVSSPRHWAVCQLATLDGVSAFRDTGRASARDTGQGVSFPRHLAQCQLATLGRVPAFRDTRQSASSRHSVACQLSATLDSMPIRDTGPGASSRHWAGCQLSATLGRVSAFRNTWQSVSSRHGAE